MSDHVEARAWQTVLDRIESDLLTGALSPGDHLPAERTLAADLGVGRSSVREALRVLEVMGLIRTQTGSGPQSGAIIIARPSGAMSALLRLQVAARGFAVDDIVATRLVLESAVSTQLATRIRAAAIERPGDGSAPSAPDLVEVHELLAAMDEPDIADAPAEFLPLDQAFHLALAAASGNQVIAATMAGLRASIEAYVLEGASFLPDWATTSRRLRAEHHAVVEAITAGDAASAESRMRDHIETYHSETSRARAAHTAGAGG
ncbi:FadR/GntR family transcriptional regulator [Cnuibacter sp. UC19_7]|uniref:FadR/GntR family transcriptional regulator n=1 Tax=Cnuibacter sp. UC19_7 TaxID=3350166 RepID=UPI00366B4BC2